MGENPIDDPDQLVAGCRAGDRDSQRRLYDKCSPRVYRLAMRMVGVQDAADVTQQTFLRAFCHLDQYDGNARFETWLYRLAVRTRGVGAPQIHRISSYNEEGLDSVVWYRP